MFCGHKLGCWMALALRTDQKPDKRIAAIMNLMSVNDGLVCSFPPKKPRFLPGCLRYKVRSLPWDK